MKTYTSTDLASLEIEAFESITEQCIFRYKLTDGELGWLDWIGNRYSIAVYISDNMNWDTGTAELDSMGISEALHDDSVDRAPCLCENTQLQRLIWYVGPDLAGEE